MKKLALLTAAATLTMSGVVMTIKSFVPAVTAATMAATEPGRTAAAPPDMMVIVPAEVIDPKADVLIGTGDGSNGAWVKP
jgi:hypothetical protein